MCAENNSKVWLSLEKEGEDWWLMPPLGAGRGWRLLWCSSMMMKSKAHLLSYILRNELRRPWDVKGSVKNSSTVTKTQDPQFCFSTIYFTAYSMQSSWDITTICATINTLLLTTDRYTSVYTRDILLLPLSTVIYLSLST